MKIKFFFSYILLIIFLTSCSNKQEKITTIKETNLESQMIEVYNQAMTEFERGDVIFAGKKFGEVELLYPSIYMGSSSCSYVSVWIFFSRILW